MSSSSSSSSTALSNTTSSSSSSSSSSSTAISSTSSASTAVSYTSSSSSSTAIDSMVYHIDIPVFQWPIDWSNPANGAWNFDIGQLRIGFGAEIIDPQQQYIIRGFQVEASFRDDDIDVVTFMFDDLVKGRANPFWFPGPPAQFRIYDGISTTQFKIKDQEGAETWEIHPGMYLWFTKPGQTPQISEVNTIADNGDGTETVTTADVLDTAVDETWQVHPLYLVRLADESEEVIHGAERYQRRALRVVELPHDYDLLEPGVTEPSKPIFLYRFTADIDGTTYTWNFTSYRHDAIISVTQWLAVGIEHTALTRSTKLGGTVNITADYEFVEPLRLCVPMRFTSPLICEILETTEALGTPEVVFKGTIRKPQVRGRSVTAQCVEWADSMEQKIPAFFIQRDCPHTIFDQNTCKAVQATYEKSVTITAYTGRTLTLKGVSLVGATANYYAQGWIEFGTGLNRRVLFVMSSSAVSGSGANATITADVSMEPDFEVSQGATIVPGCTGERSVCIAKFKNLTNFGGMATPRDNLTLTAIKTNPTTGGKK